MAAPPASFPGAPRKGGSWFSGLALVMAAGPRVWAAYWDRSVFSPDEIYESMEPAHRMAFGTGMLPKAFEEGRHSLLFPGLLSGVLRVASAAGAHSAVALVVLCKAMMACASIVSVWLAMKLARALRGERAAVLTGLLACGCAPLVAFGSRFFAETATVPLLVGAVLLIELRGAGRAALAGAMVSVTAFVRLPDVAFAVGLLGLLLARRRVREARAFAVAAAAVAVAAGALDWATWGAPFHSFTLDLSESVKAFRAAKYDRGALLYYPEHFGASLGVSFGVVLFGLALAWERASGWILVLGAFLLACVAYPTRELRFAQPLLLLALSLAAVGLDRAMDGLRAGPWPARMLGLMCAAQMGWIAQAPTRGQLGFGGSDWVTWHSGEDYFRTTEAAAKTPDLCGVVYVDNEPPWTGGYTYLHRKVPIFYDTKAEHLAAANAVIGSTTEKLPAEWRKSFENGHYGLWVRPGPCSSPPKDWKMLLP